MGRSRGCGRRHVVNEHLRRAAAWGVLAALIAVLLTTAAAGRIRAIRRAHRARHPRAPALNPDGQPLSEDELLELLLIAFWNHIPERDRS